MPILQANSADYIIRVRDNLIYQQERGARAEATVTADAVSVGQTLVIKASAFGTAANSYTVVVTLPGGTSALAVTFVGGVLTIALGVTAGVATAGANTLNKIAAAILALSGSPFIAYASGNGLGERLTAVSSATFSGGTAARDGAPAAPQNYMFAQDAATVLQLLQSKLTASCTATAGSTTTATLTTATEANVWRGALVTFASNTTTVLLRGVTARVLSNTTTVLTFSSTLAAAVANTDTFTLAHDFMNDAILDLRQGRTSLSAAPPANVYGYERIVVDAFGRFLQTLGSTALGGRSMAWPTATIGVGSTSSVIVVNQVYLIDELKNMFMTQGGVERKIVSNTESTITVVPAFASAPVSTTAYTINTKPMQAWDNQHVHPGGHPFNYVIGGLITTLLAAVVAVTLPT